MTLDNRLIALKAIELGKMAVEATTTAGSGHPTTALSLAHIVATLMYGVMRWDPKTPDHPGSDRLVLSEGHAVPIIYAACADLGVTISPGGHQRPMTVDDLMQLRAIDSIIDGHPNPALGFPFFDAATGSLGQGLSVAAGLAAAARVDGIDKYIYCLIGDGESREGQVWEAMDFIADHKLTKVIAIFNCNTLGQSDFVSSAEDWSHLQRKASAFGWTAIAVDGHDPGAIEAAIRSRHNSSDDRPLCILARTIKGWGVPALAGMGHHGTPVPKKELAATLAALDARAAELGAGNRKTAETTSLRIAEPLAVAKRAAPRPAIGFQAAVDREEKVAAMIKEKGLLSPRRAFGLALHALGDADHDVVALDADVKNSTYALDFAKACPDRYFEARIAEQNMVSVAAGLSSGGKIAFVSTFGRFLERAFDQVEMAIIGGSNMKFVGTHVGVTLASDGPSQMALADVAFMRALAHVGDHRGNPAITVLTPSDGVSAYAMVIAMAGFSSACYLRAVRADLPLLYKDGDTFPFDGHKVIRKGEGHGRPIVIVSNGYLLHSCLKAAEHLQAKNISASVIDAYALPLNAEPILALGRAQGGTIVTVEDNYVGGLGSELSEAAAKDRNGPRIHAMVVHRIPKSGHTPDDVLAYVHLSVEDIVQAVEAATLG